MLSHAKVGDYVKIIKELPYKDNMGVEIGDIGIVNYVASTYKYSVHIDDKKNPHDDSQSPKRQYGKPYDFWIPFDCCEVFKTKFKIGDKVISINSKSIFYRQTGIVKGYGSKGTILVLMDEYKPDIKREDGCWYFNERELDKYEDVLHECLFENASIFDDIKNNLENFHIEYECKFDKESEEKNMSIKNQKIVDLYMQRKFDAFEREYNEKKKAIYEEDENQKFSNTLKCQFDQYIEKNKEYFNRFPLQCEIILPPSSETTEKIDELDKWYNDKMDQMKAFREEVIAMLSGCETYEQEMDVLYSYGIVTYRAGDFAKMKTDFQKETN